ncbi:MAG: DUF4188 domain-containing protein [Polyangiaceae bacterium]
MKTTNARMVSNYEGDVVVFLIGMRVNRWWKPWQWLRTAMAMPRMLRELAQHPELGLLHADSWFGRTTMMVSYWKSYEHLHAYAKMRNAEHLPAWRAFNKHIGTNGDVGIWHETYRVRAGEYENVYVNMPTFGLGTLAGIKAAQANRKGSHASLPSREQVVAVSP